MNVQRENVQELKIVCINSIIWGVPDSYIMFQLHTSLMVANLIRINKRIIVIVLTEWNVCGFPL